jgi:RecJ-like exonuclease
LEIKEMAQDSKRRCPDCEIDISGLSFSKKGDGRCIECKGTGHDKHSEALVQFATLGQEGDNYPCKTCSGTGQCQTCGGTGYEYYTEVDDNHKTNEEYLATHRHETEMNDSSDAYLKGAIRKKVEKDMNRETYILIFTMGIGVLWGWLEGGWFGAFIGFIIGSILAQAINKVVGWFT